MTNLLGAPEQKSIRRERRFRFAAASFIAASLVFFSGIAVLVPLLIGAWGRERAQTNLLTFTRRAETGAGASPEETKVLLVQANKEIEALSDAVSAPSVGELFERIVGLAGDEVLIRALVYRVSDTKAEQVEPWTIEARGTARTREALTALGRQLDMDPVIGRADIPLENFAPDRDIDFSVTITGAAAKR